VLAPLLKTKLYAPPVRAECISRARLLAQLSDAITSGCRLVLISAPAGSGKSTLLSEWGHSLEARPVRPSAPGTPVVRSLSARVAWVSLDERDNDPATFWAYVIAALGHVRAEIGRSAMAMLRSADPPPIETVLATLINEIDEAPEPDRDEADLVLILDDYHLIEAQPIHSAVAYLLDHLPPRMHLVLASRSDPPLPLSQLRGRGQMIETRQADLRFTPEEATAFLNETMGLSLSAEQIDALERRTEGWIVGLQMAALSMRGRGKAQVDHFVRSFAGSHRYVLDYLTDEVLQRQPPDVQHFLLQTSVLDRLTGSLCNAVTGREGGDEMLEQLEAANLFVVPLDSERRWYRYHHLFAELLRRRLEETQPDQVSILHRWASEWYEGRGLIAEAVHYGLVAGDVERVARLVGGNALAMAEHGELSTLKEWLSALPGETVRVQPWLCIAQAWVLAFTGQLDEVEPLLQDAERTAGSWEELTETQHIRAHIAAVQTYVAMIRGEESKTAKLARQALELLPTDDGMTRGWAAMVLGLNLYQGGDTGAADQALAEAVVISQASGDSHVGVLALCNLAAVRMEKGELRRAAGPLRDALRLAADFAARSGQLLPISAYAHMLFGSLMYEQNDLMSAMGHLREAIDIGEQWGEPLRLIGAYTQLANLLQARGSTEAALDALARAKQLSSGLSPWTTARVAMAEALVRLRQGAIAEASRWAASYEDALADYFSVFERWSASLAKARVDIAQGRLDSALALLQQVRRDAEAAGMMVHVIEARTLQAMAYHAQGSLEPALEALDGALRLAEPEGYLRIFLDEGPPMRALLGETARRGIAPGYVGRLLMAFGETADHGQQAPDDAPPVVEPEPPTLHRPVSAPIEPLTERELEVLRLLAAGLANQEVAETLYLSINTVKSHLKNIYSKLDVRSRAHAVHRARELAIL
jgi:LuxR family maltose regulon positive regulatory protein